MDNNELGAAIRRKPMGRPRKIKEMVATTEPIHADTLNVEDVIVEPDEGVTEVPTLTPDEKMAILENEAVAFERKGRAEEDRMRKEMEELRRENQYARERLKQYGENIKGDHIEGLRSLVGVVINLTNSGKIIKRFIERVKDDPTVMENFLKKCQLEGLEGRIELYTPDMALTGWPKRASGVEMEVGMGKAPSWRTDSNEAPEVIMPSGAFSE